MHVWIEVDIQKLVPPHPQTMDIEEIPPVDELSKKRIYDHKEINPTTHGLNGFERRLFPRLSILTLGNVSIWKGNLFNPELRTVDLCLLANGVSWRRVSWVWTHLSNLPNPGASSVIYNLDPLGMWISLFRAAIPNTINILCSIWSGEPDSGQPHPPNW